jgi:hypothetical protein
MRNMIFTKDQLEKLAESLLKAGGLTAHDASVIACDLVFLLLVTCPFQH